MVDVRIGRPPGPNGEPVHDTGRALRVYSNAEQVGVLGEAQDVWQFTYAKSWLDNPNGWDLAPNIPRSTITTIDGASHRPVQWFFDNLLPEERMRQALAKTAQIEGADSFALLQYLGRESAGSLILLPVDQSPDDTVAWKPLEWSELSNRIRAMPSVPLASTGQKRMSMAGAQQKLLVGWDGQQLSEPVRNTPSTHILKPDSGSDDYPHSVINEYAMMTLAKRLGLRVPRVWRAYCPQPVYIVERFDRVCEDKVCQRVHSIDACQLLGVSGLYKYREASLSTLAAAIDQTRNRIHSRLEIWRWLIFNYLIGNHDNHLKNLSFLVSRDGMQLAPAYDLLSTAVYHTIGYYGENQAQAWPNVELAIPAPKASTFAELTRAQLMESASVLGVSPQIAQRELEKIRKNLLSSMDAICQSIEAENQQFSGEALAHLAGEIGLLRTIRHVVMQDMVQRLA